MSGQSHTPRRERCTILGAVAFEQARAAGQSAFDATCARIGAHFGPAYWPNDLKERVDRAMVRGAWAVENRARYSSIAFEVDTRDVDSAVRTVERLHRAERARRAAHPGTPRAGELVLAEARLFARWFRRFGDRTIYGDIVETLTTSPIFPMPECVAAE